MKFVLLIPILVFFISCKEAKEDGLSSKTLEIQAGQKSLVCSAFEYSKGIILTAAHCITDESVSKITVNKKTKNVELIFIHEKYDEEKVDNDFALIILKDFDLSEEIPLADFVLPKDSKLKSIVYQKGKKYEKSHTIQYHKYEKIFAKDNSKPDAICKGNSGGPVYYEDEESGKTYLVGIVSGVAGSLTKDCNKGGKSVFVSMEVVGRWFQEKLF